MTIRHFEHHQPQIHDSVYIDESAVVIGQVSIDELSSVWPMCVIRGDVQAIHIGKRTNIQDGSVLHVTHGSRFSSPDGAPLMIGDDVTVGHKALLHACTIHDRCLIGMGSIIMDNAIVYSDVMIGAGSLVPPGKELESGYLWLGNPVRKIRKLHDEEHAFLTYSAEHYCRLSSRTINDLR